MLAWLGHFKLRFHQAHASGHMSTEELKDVVQRMRPKKVFPIHTEQPEMMKKLYKKTVMVKEGKSYNI